MNFSKREGYENTTPNQLENMDEQLKDDIFNAVYKIIKTFIWPGVTGQDASYHSNNPQFIWENFFHKRVSELPYAGYFLKQFESQYNALPWYKVYDLIEFLIPLPDIHENIPRVLNTVLERNNSPYRIINNIVQPISNKETIEMIDTAFNNVPTQETKKHLEKAEHLYSQKQRPDFNNSCLESIKALESYLRYFFNNKEILGDNIKRLNLNQHIKKIVTGINAFRNDVSAHATKPDGYLPTREDAILIHCLCCTFINYLSTLKANQ
ncbi:AbiJ-NTD4 domain-containing protein [Legionella sp. 29fVS95]|uniref:AbiJ-NTD4 domain-containing protein n=1 Tax=Legionella sp. 29fVS95 TaxID=3402813 RepID=UPI003AF8264E